MARMKRRDPRKPMLVGEVGAIPLSDNGYLRVVPVPGRTRSVFVKHYAYVEKHGLSVPTAPTTRVARVKFPNMLFAVEYGARGSFLGLFVMRVAGPLPKTAGDVIWTRCQELELENGGTNGVCLGPAATQLITQGKLDPGQAFWNTVFVDSAGDIRAALRASKEEPVKRLMEFFDVQ